MKIDVLIYSMDTGEECIPRDMPMERTIKIKEFRPCAGKLLKQKMLTSSLLSLKMKRPLWCSLTDMWIIRGVIRLIGKNIKRSNPARFVANQLKSMC